MNGLFQDIRYALRQLRQTQVWPAIAVFTIALASAHYRHVHR